MDIGNKLTRHRTLLVILDEEEYEEKIGEVWKSLGKLGKRICYVCLNKPYKDVIADLKNQGVDVKNFFFIDVLSSYYRRQEPLENCIFVPAPTDMGSIMKAISRAVKEKGCEIVVFDTLSTFLVYKQNYLILKFTHRVLHENLTDAKKILITLKGGDILGKEREGLIKDLVMFVDVSVTLGGRKEKDFRGNCQ